MISPAKIALLMIVTSFVFLGIGFFLSR